MGVAETIAGTPGEVYQREMACGSGVVTRLAADQLAEEVALTIRDWVDDAGLGFPMISHLVTARQGARP